MPSRHNVRNGRIPTSATSISAPRPLAGSNIDRVVDFANDNCSFSFKYLQLEDTTFPAEHTDATYYYKIVERLKALSSMAVSDLLTSRSDALRCHPIDWNDNRVSRNGFGIPREEELYDRPYQISVSQEAYGRLHGFFTGNIFNLVWFDKDHSLYPGR